MNTHKTIKNYYTEVLTRSKTEQIYAAVYFDLATKKITEKQAEEILTYTKDTYLTNTHPHIIELLTRIEKKATPDAQKQAKKSLKGYMEYLIFAEYKTRNITDWEAKSALVGLTDFVKNKQNNMTSEQSG